MEPLCDTAVERFVHVAHEINHDSMVHRLLYFSSGESNAMNGADIGHAIMVLDNELKLRLEPQLELALEDIEDRNKRLDRTQISHHAPENPEVKTERSL